MEMHLYCFVKGTRMLLPGLQGQVNKEDEVRLRTSKGMLSYKPCATSQWVSQGCGGR